LFIAVAASWAGVPFVGAIVAGAAGVAASQGQLDLAAVILVATAAGEFGGCSVTTSAFGGAENCSPGRANTRSGARS
jgi:hypothetical protein